MRAKAALLGLATAVGVVASAHSQALDSRTALFNAAFAGGAAPAEIESMMQGARTDYEECLACQ